MKKSHLNNKPLKKPEDDFWSLDEVEPSLPFTEKDEEKGGGELLEEKSLDKKEEAAEQEPLLLDKLLEEDSAGKKSQFEGFAHQGKTEDVLKELEEEFLEEEQVDTLEKSEATEDEEVTEGDKAIDDEEDSEDSLEGDQALSSSQENTTEETAKEQSTPQVTASIKELTIDELLGEHDAALASKKEQEDKKEQEATEGKEKSQEEEKKEDALPTDQASPKKEPKAPEEEEKGAWAEEEKDEERGAKPLSYLEKWTLVILFALMIASAIWGSIWLSGRNAAINEDKKLVLPLAGHFTRVNSVKTFWVTGNQGRILPAIELQMQSVGKKGSVLRFFFRNEEGDIVGDTKTLPCGDSQQVRVVSTAGFSRESSFQAYQIEEGNSWKVEVLEAHDADAPRSDFRSLFKVPISAQRSE